MYTLRRILEDGMEHNFLLGKSYTLILKERVSKEEWLEASKRYWGESYEQRVNSGEENASAERKCFGFVRSESGEEYFLLPWQQNYIMTESGKTFHKFWFDERER